MGFIHNQIQVFYSKLQDAHAARHEVRLRACKILPRRGSSPDFVVNSETILLFLFSNRLGPSPYTITALDISLQADTTVPARPKKASKCSRCAGSTGARVEDAVDADDMQVRWHITARGCSLLRLSVGLFVSTTEDFFIFVRSASAPRCLYDTN